MERYEVRVKFEEIRRLTDNGDYYKAMEIADTVDWDRVKNLGMLCKVGEIYERCRYYEDSKAIYERAYRLQPQSRVTVYRLANVSIKLKDFEDAGLYLEEYRDIAPYDSNVLVLEYRIRKGQGAPVSELIDILERLKDKDYHEKWAYELAVLYAEAEQEDKCAKECDNIFLWFGEGRYVTKAMKLKSLFRTLTTEQDRFLKEGARKPAGSEEIMERADEAILESRIQQEHFAKLQEEVKNINTDAEYAEDKIRDMEDAREAALNASREAKAAELLNEAYEEQQAEEEVAASEDEQEMLGETKIPTFNLPIMDILRNQAWEQEKLKAKAEVTEHSVPGTEFIDVSTDEEEPESVCEPEKDGIETIAEVRKKILSYVDESSEDLILNDYEINSETEKESEDDAVQEETDIQPEQTLKYTNMEDLLSHADEMNSDELADSLALILSGKVSDESDKEAFEQQDSESESKGLSGVINRLWSRPAVKKPVKTPVYAEDPDIDNIEIKSEIPSRFDTLNLQKDLANSINNILNATEKSEIDKTIAVMDRSMLRNNISKYAAASENYSEQKTEEDSDWDAELMDVISEDTRKKIEEYELLESLEQELDGQIKFMVEPEEEKIDIPGQLNLEEYMQEQEKIQLEEAKIKAVKIAGEYMEQVALAAPVIAKEEAEKYLADSQKDLLEKTRALMESTEPNQDEIEEVMISLRALIAYANEIVSENMNKSSEVKSAEDTAQEISMEQLTEPDTVLESATDVEEIQEAVEEAEQVSVEEAVEETVQEPVEEIVEEPVQEPVEEIVEEPAQEPVEEIVEEPVQEPVEEIIEDTLQELAEETATEEVVVDLSKADTLTDLPVISEETLEMMNESKEAFMNSISDISAKEIPGVDKKKADKQVIPMSDEQWEIMDYFMNVPEVESQIVNFVESQYDKFDNIIICGATGSGRASLALRLYKSIRLNNPQLPNQTLKVDADALNKKSVLKIYEKISNGIVIIEHAGLLNDIAAAELEKAMKAYEGKIYTIIIGNGERIGTLLEKHEALGKMCRYKFDIPEYNQDQYVDFAKSYAYSYGYVLDEMALLALYSDLSAIKTRNKLITLQDVKLIVNEAILSNEKRLKKSFGGIFTKAKDKDGNIILKEKDFTM